ncbi:hypothetical protein C8J57DRAFT_1227015 [Mycena rebaudengoi]|nr:hypothetical protein C8J57DRAFT_1227015 [Mycena rebaudengoi]
MKKYRLDSGVDRTCTSYLSAHPIYEQDHPFDSGSSLSSGQNRGNLDAKIAQRTAEAKAKKPSDNDIDNDMGNNKRRLVFEDQDEVGRVGSPFTFRNMADAIGEDE